MAKYIDTLLRKTLLELMEKKPLDEISVVELAQRAEVNRKTFYNHFPDIASVAVSVAWQELDALSDQSVSFENWDGTLIRMAAWLYDNAPFMRAVWASKSRQAFEQGFEERLSEQVARVVDDAILWLGDYHGETYSVSRVQRRYLTRYYTALIGAVVAGWIDGGMRETPDEVVELIKALNSDGLYDGVRLFTMRNERQE